MTCFISMLVVTEPTPPGTGVMAATISLAASKSAPAVASFDADLGDSCTLAVASVAAGVLSYEVVRQRLLSGRK